MGETGSFDEQKWEQAEIRYENLRKSGKTPDEINELFKQESLNRLQGKALIIFIKKKSLPLKKN